MAKGQKSNREKRKPKSDKPKAAVQPSSFSASAGIGKTKGAPPKKGR